MTISEQLEKEKKIKQEINRIKKIYKDLGKEKLKFVESMIHEVAFMKISLEELRDDLMKNGMTEMFEQGEQCFERERPTVKIYTNFIQKYSTAYKMLIDLMPGEVQKQEQDDLMMFVRKGTVKK